MAYYVAKGLQLAGMAAVGAALLIGLTQPDAIVREVALAMLGVGVFYAGRLLEPR
jgi:hypothetical protein